MNTKQIDCVIELCNTLNFSQAAENLFISQPSLSYQIKELEAEIGFRIFERSGKGATLTPAGEQFCLNLRRIKDDILAAIEQGQNVGSKYSESLNVCLPLRACLYYLPEIMQRFEREMPHIALNINYVYGDRRIDELLKGEQDIVFAKDSDLARYSAVAFEQIFVSRFYVITRSDDVLTKKELLTADDLKGRTFMVGGGSPLEMQKVQKRIIETTDVTVINCRDHETALTNVAARRGILVSPGFTNDHTGEFAWIPFDCEEHLNCGFGYRTDDKRESTKRFIEITKAFYKNSFNIPL